MKRLKKKQLGAWCKFCPPKTTRATHVQYAWAGMFCCEEHIDNLRAYEAHEERHLTEADYQTWVGL